MTPSNNCPASSIPFRPASGIQANLELAKRRVDDEALLMERKRLRRHLGLGELPGDPLLDPPEFQPLFFIEKTPDSKAGTECRLPGCTQRIACGDLRLALNPAMGSENWYRATSDFYHIDCFETIADFSDAHFLDRIQPLTRNTWRLRGLKASSILDGSYLVPGGVERLVLEWKIIRGRWIDKRDGVYNRWEEEDRLMDATFDDLLHKAGSSMYKPCGRPAMLDHYEYYNLSQSLAPYESDGPKDRNEWNLFASYLNSTADALRNPHDLSEMLQRWENDVMLAWEDSRKLGETQKEARSAMGEKAIRALKRLSAIPTPQVGFNRLFSV